MISFVIPTLNEAGNVVPLFDEIKSVMQKIGGKYEVIFVNDGSRDNTQAELNKLKTKHGSHVSIIEFTHNFGKASALSAGFKHAKGDLICTMDADLQDVPAELPKMIAKINEGCDMVSGWKQKRKDSFIKNKTSKIFNYATNMISKAKLHDFNCGFKLYKKEAIEDLNLYGELHRYIPVLVSAHGYRVGEVKVAHRPRVHGHTKYSSSRFIHGFLDLFTVLFITRFRTRPLHLFGVAGMLSFFLGFAVGIYLTYIKLFNHQSIGERPLLLFSVMLMIMGVQLGVMGLVGEHITTLLHKNEKNYKVKKSSSV